MPRYVQNTAGVAGEEHETVFLQEPLRLIGSDIFEQMALSYGFERIGLSYIEHGGDVAALERAGLLQTRHPIGIPGIGAGAALRFSGPVGLLRSYDSLHLSERIHPLRLFFSGPVVYKNENAEYIEAEEHGVAVVGESEAMAEAVIAQVLWKSLQEQGVSEGAELWVNALGCAQCRTSFRNAFGSYLRPRMVRLCKTCQDQTRKTPFRVFECQDDKCMITARGAPQILDFLCEGCKKHLRGFLEFLDELAIPYYLKAQMFRDGLWFNNLLFEFVAPSGQDTPLLGSAGGRPAPPRFVLGEGGRMSRAAECLMGKRIDAVAGVLFPLVAESYARTLTPRPMTQREPRVFLAHLGDFAKRKSLQVVEMLRKEGISVVDFLGSDSIKSQLRVAERLDVSLALILGQKEALDQTIIVRDVRSGMQEIMPQEKLVEFLKKKMKK